MTSGVRKCRLCGVPVDPGRMGQRKFCRRCIKVRQARQRKEHRARQQDAVRVLKYGTADLRCQHCGDVIPPERPRQSRTCSELCASQRQYQQSLDWHRKARANLRPENGG